MSPNPFDPDFHSLPTTLAIFPLPGALLLPGAVLPLNIFEPRYLNMTFDALGNDRLFGMIQPDDSETTEGLYPVGCAGRITAFQETTDGRLLINLTGICRFSIAQELEPHRGYRRVRPCWDGFGADLTPVDTGAVDPTGLIEAASRYFTARHVEFDADRLGQLNAVEIANFLAMNLPLDPADKQLILEAGSFEERARILLTITEMSLASSTNKTRH